MIAECGCYRDDDGLHPCDAIRAVPGLSSGDYLNHIRDAFKLWPAREKPKHAIKTESGLWKAPCGCTFRDVEPPTIFNACYGVGLSDHNQPERNNHIAEAVWYIMREQVYISSDVGTRTEEYKKYMHDHNCLSNAVAWEAWEACWERLYPYTLLKQPSSDKVAKAYLDWLQYEKDPSHYELFRAGAQWRSQC